MCTMYMCECCDEDHGWSGRPENVAKTKTPRHLHRSQSAVGMKTIMNIVVLIVGNWFCFLFRRLKPNVRKIITNCNSVTSHTRATAQYTVLYTCASHTGSDSLLFMTQQTIVCPIRQQCAFNIRRIKGNNDEAFINCRKRIMGKK